MTQTSFSRLPREQRIGSIMRAAREVFLEKGYAATSMAEVAARAGVVEGSVYRFFEHKRALLVRVVEDWYEEMLSDYDAHLQRIEGTWDRLRYLVFRHLTIIQNEPELCRLVFGELRPGEDYRSTRVFSLNQAYVRRTMEILREGVERGDVRADMPLRLARDMIYGGVEHHTWAFLRGEGTFSATEAADGIVMLIHGGLEQRAATESPLDPALLRLERVAARLEAASPPERTDVSKSRRR